MNPETPKTPMAVPTDISAPPASPIAVIACAAVKADGSPCRMLALAGSPFCFWHGDRELVAAAGRKGSRVSHEHHKVVVGPGRIRLADADEIRKLLASAVNGLRRGEIAPTTANSLCRLLSTGLQLIQVADLARRLKRLEEAAGSTKRAR